MDKQNILILSRSFYPDNSPRSFRTTELAKEFAAQGHEVTVITPHKGEIHYDFEKRHRFKIKDMGMPTWQVPVVKGPTLERLIRRLIVRLASLWFEYPHLELLKMVKRSLAKESGYDLLISIAVPYPVHWGVASIRSSKHPIARCWIADCGDPYMGAENDSFKHPFYFKYVEKWFSRKTDHITVPTAGSVNAYYPEFHHKISVISQGFKFEDVKMFQGIKTNEIPEFGYAGNFIPTKRDPSEFLEYLCGLNEDYRFHIYTSRQDLVQAFAERSKGRIIVKNPLSRLEVLFELSKLDFLVNFENAGSRQTPSKLIDYAILNKPVLSIATGRLNVAVAAEFLKGDYRNQYVIPDPDQYRIENICKRFMDLSTKQEKSIINV